MKKYILVIDNKSATRSFVVDRLVALEYGVLASPVASRMKYATTIPAPDLVLINPGPLSKPENLAALTDACGYATALGSPLLLLTGALSPEAAGTAIACGVSDYILSSAPTLRTFYAKVEYWIKRRMDTELERELSENARQALYVASSTMTDLCVSARCETEMPFLLIRKHCLTILNVLEHQQSMKAFAARLQEDADLVIHLLRVGMYAGWLAAALGCTEAEFWEAVIGGTLHDTGKTLTPGEILNHPGKLDGEWLRIMQLHPTQSVEILRRTEGVSSSTIEIAGNHHERLDGEGYPNGIPGARISIPTRIVAITDAYDAQTSRRAYNKPVPKELALERLKNPPGHLDQELVAVFTNVMMSHRGQCSAVG